MVTNIYPGPGPCASCLFYTGRACRMGLPVVKAPGFTCPWHQARSVARGESGFSGLPEALAGEGGNRAALEQVRLIGPSRWR